MIPLAGYKSRPAGVKGAPRWILGMRGQARPGLGELLGPGPQPGDWRPARSTGGYPGGVGGGPSDQAGIETASRK